jgi:hypothetical protein
MTEQKCYQLTTKLILDCVNPCFLAAYKCCYEKVDKRVTLNILLEYVPQTLDTYMSKCYHIDPHSLSSDTDSDSIPTSPISLTSLPSTSTSSLSLYDIDTVAFVREFLSSVTQVLCAIAAYSALDIVHNNLYPDSIHIVDKSNISSFIHVICGQKKINIPVYENIYIVSDFSNATIHNHNDTHFAAHINEATMKVAPELIKYVDRYTNISPYKRDVLSFISSMYIYCKISETKSSFNLSYIRNILHKILANLYNTAIAGPDKLVDFITDNVEDVIIALEHLGEEHPISQTYL